MKGITILKRKKVTANSSNKAKVRRSKRFKLKPGKIRSKSGKIYYKSKIQGGK